MQSAVKHYYNINKILLSKLGGWPTQIMIYSLMSLYMLIPVTPQLLDLFIPLNKSRSYKYLFDIDYSFDREVYYYPVLLHSYLTTVLTMSLMVITDTSYMSFAQHACSLFAAIGYHKILIMFQRHRLENLVSESNSKKNNYFVEDVICNKSKSRDYEDQTYHELILLLRKHQLSIEYTRLLNSLFEMYSFMLLFITIIIMSLLGIQIQHVVVQNVTKNDTAIQYITLQRFCALYINRWQNVRIIDGELYFDGAGSYIVFHRPFVLQIIYDKKKGRKIVR
ncbi:hypothetical protein ALC53_13357 [Atta colombica]|uniref:Uncharacterized protein n=1 Tax=Atta colombica TaxID=520822 RepID=A0A195AWB8_9HYME|nr:hypothetical protein ALC53_13357 [Atta colombica]